jgi:hypothetical protein
VTFVAAFPQIQCIKYLGDGGARIVLDIPQSDEGAVESLRQWRDRVLVGTVVPMERGAVQNTAEQGDGEEQHDMAGWTKRQPRWETAET